MNKIDLWELARKSLLECFARYCEGLVLVDTEARIVGMNDKYPKLLNLSDPKQWQGRPINDVIPNTKMPGVAKSGQPILLDIMHHGSKTFVVSRLPIFDEETGELSGAVGIVLDDEAESNLPKAQKLKIERASRAKKWWARYTIDDFSAKARVASNSRSKL